MKPTDLRIGNFVRIKSTGAIAKVVSLNPNEVGFHYCNNNLYVRPREYSQIEGVLIYGTKRDIECPSLYWCDDYDDGKWYGYYGCERAIRYIHELQNIHHALTGEELKIEL